MSKLAGGNVMTDTCAESCKVRQILCIDIRVSTSSTACSTCKMSGSETRRRLSPQSLTTSCALAFKILIQGYGCPSPSVQSSVKLTRSLAFQQTIPRAMGICLAGGCFGSTQVHYSFMSSVRPGQGKTCARKDVYQSS